MAQTSSRISKDDVKAMLYTRNKESFEFLYNQYSTAVYGLIVKKIGDNNTAEKILENIFIEMWNKMPTLDLNTFSIFTWLYRITQEKVKKISL